MSLLKWLSGSKVRSRTTSENSNDDINATKSTNNPRTRAKSKSPVRLVQESQHVDSDTDLVSKIDVESENTASKLSHSPIDNFTGNSQNTSETNETDWASFNLDKCFEKITPLKGKGRKFVRCNVCFRNPNIVVLHCKQKNHVPAICSEGGTLPRTSILENHLKSKEHIECIKTDKLRNLSDSELTQTAPLNKIFSFQNKKLSQKIADFMCTVFNDAKRGTLSAWSWPSREVTFLKRKNLDINNYNICFDLKEGDLQYITPINHKEFLRCIVKSDLKELKESLNSCLAISLRVDGSVDRMQIDNIHVLAKAVLSDGSTKLFFIGFEEHEERGALGYYKAIKKTVEHIFPWTEFLLKISSIVTDGATINTGHKGGLWSLIEEDRKSHLLPDNNGPLLKIWCAVHRSSLAWENLTSRVIEVKKIKEFCSSISSFFHRSGLRTKELNKIAKTYGLKIIHFPKYFEVRWTEFTYGLLQAVLRNWYAMVLYFTKEQSDRSCAGFLKLLTNYDKMQLLCILTDLGYLYSRFQKLIQSDDVHIFDIRDQASILTTRIESLKNTALLGGWEEKFLKSFVLDTTKPNEKDDGIYFLLNGISLYKVVPGITQRRRRIHHLFVSDHRIFEAIRKELIETLLSYFNEKLDVTEWIDLRPLKSFDNHYTDIELKKCQEKICSDFPLIDFLSSYREVSLREEFLNKNLSIHLLKKLLKCDQWKSLAIPCARILAAKPHSADVERLISYYNILKTPMRSQISPETIKNCLYVKINMTTVIEFNPLPSVSYWLAEKDCHEKIYPLAKTQEWYQGVFQEAYEREGRFENDQNTSDKIIHF